MATRIQSAGEFLTHRSLSGAAAADSSTINDTNFPIAGGFDSYGWESTLVYWTATGESYATHELVLEPLYRDGTNGRWLRGAKFTVKPGAVAEIPSLGFGLVFIRIDSASAAGATDVRIRVGGGLVTRRG
jgi:hypothetical protein